MPKFKRLFWDIETTPNIGVFWKASRKVWIPYDNILHEKQIVCICYKWEGAKQVFSVDWGDGSPEAQRDMLQSFLAVAEEADELVAHNGDKFDLKWFNTQLLLHNLPALTAPKTVDTLVIARRRFYLNSNRLDYIASLLGIGSKHNKPEFADWIALAQDQSPAARKRMVRYCKNDILLLEEVYQTLSRFHGNKTHVGVLEGKAKWTCAHCGSESVRRKKRRVTAKGSIQHSMVCKQCGRHYTISNRAYEEFEEE